VVRTVNVNWNSDNRKWNFNANEFDDNQWNDGNRVFWLLMKVSPAKF
jgi:hypothetical protein